MEKKSADEKEELDVTVTTDRLLEIETAPATAKLLLNDAPPITLNAPDIVTSPSPRTLNFSSAAAIPYTALCKKQVHNKKQK